MITPGRETSEHSRATRAEVGALVFMACGLVLALLGAFTQWPVAAVGVLLAAIGATLLASVNRAYMDSRGGIKAAAMRPRVGSA